MSASQEPFSWLLSTDKVGTSVCGLLRAMERGWVQGNNTIAGRDRHCCCISSYVCPFLHNAALPVVFCEVVTILECRTPDRRPLSFPLPGQITSRRWRILRGGNRCRRSIRNMSCESFR